VNARKKRIYGAVLLVGLGALLVDRVFLTPPASAVASGGAAAEGVADASAYPESAADGPAVSVCAAPFPRGLPEGEGQGPPRDAFVLTAAARRAMLGIEAGDAEFFGPAGRTKPQRGMTALEFQSAHGLSAVMSGPAARVAIVDGRWLRVGDVLDGCKLLAITGQSAVFACPNGKVVLSVSLPGGVTNP